MSEYLDIKKAAALLECTQRHLRRMCVTGQLPGAIKMGSRYKIPQTADPRLIPKEQPNEELCSHTELTDIPINKRNEAIRKLGIIQNFERFAAGYEAGRNTAIEVYASQHNIGKRTLQRWLRKFREQGILGLVDIRGGGRFISQIISPEAFEYFKGMYLTQQRLSVRACWANINFINRQENRNWKIPTLRTMYQFVKTQIPLFVQVLHREGKAAYEAKCAPYIQTNPDSVAAGEIWVGDHCQLNCWIRHRGRWIRPWVTAWMDMRSRCIVGWHISPQPNQTTILLAAKRAIEKHGPPDMVKIDNGRDYDSEMWTGITKARRRALRKGYLDESMIAGIYAMMDIGVSFAIPYHPQSKGILERWFDTVDQQFTKMVPTYCGKTTDSKPDYINEFLKSKKALVEAYDIDSFVELVGQYINNYNNTAHTGWGMAGKTPAEVLAGRSSRRVLQEGVLDMVARGWSGELLVSKNGVRHRGIFYGQFNTDLLAYQGKKIRIAYDPDDLRKVYVYDSITLRLLTIAEQNQLINYNSSVSEEDLRHAMRQKSKALAVAKAYRDSQPTANMDLVTLTIRAMEDGRKKTQEEQVQSTLRPVRTLMDGQVREHKHQETRRILKKAVGAESLTSVLDINYDELMPKENRGLNLFND